MTETRKLVVLSDGTGNSAAAESKTNVWRLYQALDVTDGTQIAVFSDGVGTSNIKPLRILGQALGFGVQLNVIRLYKFLCRNYVEGDEIWAFGFSRGAFTIRVLVGLIEREGLVTWETEADLDRNALAAYRAFRGKAFKSPLPWVKLHRYIRARWTDAWNDLTQRTSYAIVAKQTIEARRKPVPVRFVGVWDTVAAYGLPVQELTDAFNKWVWPLSFSDTHLCKGVEHARQALSLDDDRRTFFPIPWDEPPEVAKDGKHSEVRPDRLRQVWFAGAHASIGGGYPDDGVSLVALNWMIGEARDKGLRFLPPIVEEFAALANPTGRIYDPRSGLGALYRYQPRDVQKLLKDGNTPLVHGSVITRIVSGTDGYAPISLPEKIDVLLPDGESVALTVPAAEAALRNIKPAWKTISPQESNKKLILDNTLKVAKAAAKRTDRTEIFELVKDTVWWRQINYFVSILFVAGALVFPFLPISTSAGDEPSKGLLPELFRVPDANQILRGPVTTILDLITGFLPWFLDPWVSAVRQHPVTATLIAVGLGINLNIGSFLEGRIRDRARAAWNMGVKAKPLRLTGRRGAAISFFMIFAVLAIGALSTHLGWAAAVNPLYIAFFLVMAAAFYARWRVLCREDEASKGNDPTFPGSPLHKAKDLDPTNPGRFLTFARKMRTDGWAAGVYGGVEKIVAPGVLLLLATFVSLTLLNRGLFDLASSGGAFCTNTKGMKDAGDESLGSTFTFTTNSICQPTGIRLREGMKYRIQIDIGGKDHKDYAKDEWLDQDRHTDVAGFSPELVAGDIVYFIGSPLKRWWREKWFQPIVRISEFGNNEHPLKPAAPLPPSLFVDPKDCQHDSDGSVSGSENISSSALESAKIKDPACDKGKRNEPDMTLISDITADATGELFIYVNDAVLAFPGQSGLFYKNNRGEAKGFVQRIVANSIIPAPSADKLEENK